MRKRFLVAACMTILLLAGMVSSAVCEVACAPTRTFAAACCPQQMRHCEKASIIAHAQTCGHPQESPTTAITDSYGLQITTAPPFAVSIAATGSPWFPAHSDPSLSGLARSSFTVPLRI
ncbi:MAG TPA: hypothetical protein VHB45_11195 [Alloacidobacterium sp.]|nr:hypothetical protein [Alloacidobacterium sp.]